MVKHGGWFSIENFVWSYLWQVPAYIKLTKIDGVRFIEGDQCLMGGIYRKPTGWLSSAPFVASLEGECPGPPVHPVHPLLQGWAQAGIDGSWHWLTEFAA